MRFFFHQLSVGENWSRGFRRVGAYVVFIGDIMEQPLNPMLHTSQVNMFFLLSRPVPPHKKIKSELREAMLFICLFRPHT